MNERMRAREWKRETKVNKKHQLTKIPLNEMLLQLLAQYWHEEKSGQLWPWLGNVHYAPFAKSELCGAPCSLGIIICPSE